MILAERYPTNEGDRNATILDTFVMNKLDYKANRHLFYYLHQNRLGKAKGNPKFQHATYLLGTPTRKSSYKMFNNKWWGCAGEERDGL